MRKSYLNKTKLVGCVFCGLKPILIKLSIYINFENIKK